MKVSDHNLLNQKQAVHLLGCTRMTLYNYRKKGIIQAIRIGGRLYFNKENLIQDIQNTKHNG